ncbi:MAG: hypothetical protein FWE11_10950 [Defluviitaleaceae bacterium]|nr:hypothetical protein [Defluviitaleaceae bacterium]
MTALCKNHCRPPIAEGIISNYRYMLWRKIAKLEKSDAKLKFIESLTKTLFEYNNKDMGQKMYAVIHHTYMTKKEPADLKEILARLSKAGTQVSQPAYYRIKSKALGLLDERLAIIAAGIN